MSAAVARAGADPGGLPWVAKAAAASATAELVAADLIAAPFEPAIRLAPGEIATRNRIHRPRAPVRAMIEGSELEIDAPDATEANAAGPQLGLVWAIGGSEVLVTVGLDALERLLAGLQPDLVDLPDDATLPLLVELALAPLLERAEAIVGATLSCRGVRRGARSLIETEDALTFPLRFGGAAHRAAIGLLAPESGRWAEVLDRIAQLADAALPPAEAARRHAAVPVTVAFVAGALSLSVAELASLRSGDVLIPDELGLARNEIRVVVGGRHVASARVDGQDLRLLTALSKLHPLEETTPMPPEAPPAASPGSAPGSEAALVDEVEIGLRFEIGRDTIAVGELRAIGPGYVFALGRDPKSAIDILANGRRIGRGEIVRVGDTLGVRVSRLSGAGEQA